LGGDLEERIRCALLRWLRECDGDRPEPRDVVALREDRERGRLHERRARRAAGDLEESGEQCEYDHRRDRGPEGAEPSQERRGVHLFTSNADMTVAIVPSAKRALARSVCPPSSSGQSSAGSDPGASPITRPSIANVTLSMPRA